MGLSGLLWALVVLVSRENLAEMISFPVAFDVERYRELEERAEKAVFYLQDQTSLPDGEPACGFCFNCPYATSCPQYQALRKAGEQGEIQESIRLQLECQMEELVALENQLEPMQRRISELREMMKETFHRYVIIRIVLDGGIVQMVTSNRTSFDSKAFQRDAPDVYTRYLKTSSFSNLRVTASKGTIACQSTA